MFTHARRRSSIVLAAAAVIGVGVASFPAMAEPAAAQQAEVAPEAVALPSAQEVVDRYIEATGGKAAYEAIESMRVEGTIRIPAQNVTGQLVMAMEDGQIRLDQDFAAMGMKVSQGVTDGVGWDLNTMAGARLLSEKETEQLASQADPAGAADLSDFASAEITGIKPIDGVDHYEMKLVDMEGKEALRYFNVETGLLTQMTQTSVTPMGEIQMTLHMSDYEKSGELLSPKTVKMDVMGQQIEMITDKVEYNVDIPDDHFALPEEVEALLAENADNAPTTQPQ